MLRSRAKLGDTPRRLAGFQGFHGLGPRTNRGGKTRFSRRRIGFIAMTLFVFLSLYRIYRWRAVYKDGPELVLIPHATNGETAIPKHTSEGPAKERSNSTWKFPLVNRMVLFQLDRSPKFMPNGSVKPGVSNESWLPRVTSIPERFSSRSSNPNSRPGPSDREPICDSAKYPRPCRFLFPLRIAEQESKARMHFFQVAQLAKQLNRTLVLPNVGKSKLGACFRWSFDKYYDTESLAATLETDAIISLDEFQGWLDGRGQRVNSRVFLVGSSYSPRIATEGNLYSNSNNNSVHAYEVNSDDNWKADLPTCFWSKYQRLDGGNPVFLSVPKPSGRDRPSMGDSIVEAILATPSPRWNDSSHPMEAEVLILNWDLRHPVFPTPFDQQLRYSKRLLDLATQLVPAGHYLAVQWRMETVDPGLLAGCAHALTDVLGQLLNDESLARNTSTVWFASDYPHPIMPRMKAEPRSALIAKSGTFRDFDLRHEESVDILRNAFDKDNELDKWKLTDISEAMASKHIDQELMQDSGVLGILDKLISMKANLFVSGSTRCGRKRYETKYVVVRLGLSRLSSFTTQIVEARMRQREDRHLGNIIDTFG